MQENEKEKFIELMFGIGEMLDEPQANKTIEIYWLLLKDMPFELIVERMMTHVKTVGYRKMRFPLVSEIRHEPSAEERAQADYVLLDDLAKKYMFQDFPSVGRSIVAMKLKEMGRGELVPFFDRWGAELLSKTNPAATRALMIKQLKTKNSFVLQAKKVTVGKAIKHLLTHCILTSKGNIYE